MTRLAWFLGMLLGLTLIAVGTTLAGYGLWTLNPLVGIPGAVLVMFGGWLGNTGLDRLQVDRPYWG